MTEINLAIKKNGIHKEWICSQVGISLVYFSYVLSGKYKLSKAKRDKLLDIVSTYDRVRRELKLCV
ncbi:MAG: hypothetical protein VR72_17815 [Clostridiaceae bacterium BRH_c20a]|nr:MAG: hypothetical protein VR72_17815 [Clostridiaceae bacterium BRH_c20a]